ncbi:hypothetical protein PPERSA_09828 [Pseudocohnilembus persalinus]|uniref:tRNA (adenine(58)-N(1))-methyltransferase n=1 Tax=Pseudocohnilembus persalinus TaxID=266149 RepID=A0A0V0QUQ0_PSEPJ|nr:hypothetical protein PPERSA_09828 [Pseudocohnilembus persalinus]|eukprot:KRX05688.1 hypothetical protein PPERSA_09828 [Pseudocohnilembus persalinus]
MEQEKVQNNINNNQKEEQIGEVVKKIKENEVNAENIQETLVEQIENQKESQQQNLQNQDNQQQEQGEQQKKEQDEENVKKQLQEQLLKSNKLNEVPENKRDNIMKYGDMVIMYIKADQIRQIKLEEGKEEGCNYGMYPHSYFVGKPFGAKIHSRGKGGYVLGLRPTPSLLTSSLPHKTQIIYHQDCATIIFKLNIVPGSKVIESGTGSGSLSQSILSVLQDKGHLYTFEFNEERVQNGKQFFEKIGYKNVDVIHRDAIGEGFLNKEGENYDVLNSDAVFLDLPAPWKAIKHAKDVLRKGGKVACYSPCIEQCQRNVDELWRLGFIDVHTIEVVQRVHERQFQEFKKAFEVNEINVKRKREEFMDISDNMQFQNKQFVSSFGLSYGHTAYLTFAMLP